MSPTTGHLEHLQESTQRMIRTVDGLSDEQLRGRSGLPDWSRAHVVAHLALNAEGLAGALTGIVQGEPAPMYTAQEARNADIEELAAAAPSELRERLLGGCAAYADAAAALPDDEASTPIERTSGGPTFPAGAATGMRWREVEIHHADLDVEYTHRGWPTEFSAYLVATMAKREPSSEPFLARATDVREEWAFGQRDGAGDRTTVTGQAADLGWWLTGRGDGEGLNSDRGELPKIVAW